MSDPTDLNHNCMGTFCPYRASRLVGALTWGAWREHAARTPAAVAVRLGRALACWLLPLLLPALTAADEVPLTLPFCLASAMEHSRELIRSREQIESVRGDRVVVRSGLVSRLTDSVETALRIGKGSLVIATPGQADRVFTEAAGRVAQRLAIREHAELPILQ